MDSDHPCYESGCTARRIDHAVICPFLGVIAAGRCLRIQHKAPGKALDALTFRAERNHRDSIELRSRYWSSDEFDSLYRATRADNRGWLEVRAKSKAKRGHR